MMPTSAPMCRTAGISPIRPALSKRQCRACPAWVPLMRRSVRGMVFVGFTSVTSRRPACAASIQTGTLIVRWLLTIDERAARKTHLVTIKTVMDTCLGAMSPRETFEPTASIMLIATQLPPCALQAGRRERIWHASCSEHSCLAGSEEATRA
jgi:hypothetical protein